MINKKIQKIISVGIIATIMLIPTMANAEWKQDSVGWWYTEGNSYIQNGWKLINNNWYYFDNNGYMKTGWIQDTNGKWYYLSSQGNMLSNTITPDGYTLNTDGSWNTTIPKTESKQMASTSSIDSSNKSNVNNTTLKADNENETSNTSTTTTTKKKSSRSSSSSSSSSSRQDRFAYAYFYYDEEGKIILARSNEDPTYAKEPEKYPYIKVEVKNEGYNTFMEYVDHLSEKGLGKYRIENGKIVEKEETKNDKLEDTITTTTTDSQVNIE